MILQPPVVKAKTFVRKMRGESQAHLIAADDGYRYVVKFLNNPQGNRILVNELISSLLLRAIGIQTPEIALVAFDEQTLSTNPEIGIVSRREDLLIPLPGLHFGSRYPGSTGKLTVYDFFPEAMLPKLYNRNEFTGVLVFDKWACNADSRQAIFHRAHTTNVDSAVSEVRWVAQMIDHGQMFQGRDWTFRDSPVQGPYMHAAIYGRSPTLPDFEPWIEKVSRLDEDVFDTVFNAVPAPWISKEEKELVRVLLGRLQKRQEQIPQLLRETLVYLRARSKRRAKVPAVGKEPVPQP
jgi:hypothetical protein